MIRYGYFGVLLFLSLARAIPAQSSDQTGESVRKAFLACAAQHWRGKAEWPVQSAKNASSGSETTVRLDCQSYIMWWDEQGGPSPFTIWHPGEKAGREIPAEKWMGYLQLLPIINAPGPVAGSRRSQ